MTEQAYPRRSRFWTRLCVALLCLAGAPKLYANTLFQVEYQLKVAGLEVGKVIRTLSQKDGIYTFVSEARPTGFLGSFINKTYHETDRWRLDQGRIRPLSYRYVEHGDHKVVKSNLQFDWKRLEVCELTRKDVCWQLTEHSQDPASTTFVMMAAAANQVSRLMVHAIGGRRPEDHHFESTGKGEYRHGKTHLQVVKYHQTDHMPLRLKVWLAPSRAYLPVYIHQVSEDGPDSVLRLTSIVTLDTGALLRIWGE